MSVEVFRALASHKRLQILEWLKNPRAHFPKQVDGDLVTDGVCSLFLAQKLGVRPPTASVHLRVMTRAGLLSAKKIRQWTFYKRNEKGIRTAKSLIAKLL
jgi:ArsR family transcriptional regulator